MNVKPISPRRSLHCELRVPGDKSISHRAVMLGAIADGTTEITNFLSSADCLATIDCFRRLGVTITDHAGRLRIEGRGLNGLQAPVATLDVKNSGTTTRLMAGILSGQSFETTLSGDASLNRRPMGRIITPLSNMGADITSLPGNGCAPLRLRPGRLHGIHYVSPVASAQVKSALLLAGLYCREPVTVTEPTLSRNHTELMLESFGGTVKTEQPADGPAVITTYPVTHLTGRQLMVPGDISSAAYFLAAGLLVPDSEVLVKNVGINPTRAGFLTVCRAMGANLELHNVRRSGGEQTADILARTSRLHGTTIGGALIPTLIDELPILAVMAAAADGTTVIQDAAELKVKETNRIDTITEGLTRLGAAVTATDDGLIIAGGRSLGGAVIDSHGDHRIAMAFAVAGLLAGGETQIADADCVDVSYPGFWETPLFTR